MKKLILHTDLKHLLLLVGRNALHLAAKYGHALCLQKLLQVGVLETLQWGIVKLECALGVFRV